jgi:dienelactone hydrolase
VSPRPAAPDPITGPIPPAPPIPIRVVKPAGDGPFAAVVLLHGCGGVDRGPQGPQSRWSRTLRDEGYVVLIPDSFSTRGHEGGVCTNPSPSRNDVAPRRRVEDAFAALAHARALPYVDGRRVALMGHSHGGASALATMWQAPRGAGHFIAAIAFYPSCGVRYGEWRGPGDSGVYRPRAPLLILTGEKDDWTPAEPCRVLAERSHAAGLPVSIKVYPDAHHAFDGPAPLRYVPERMNANAPGGRGATTAGNPQAWADSVVQVKEFLARYLR